MRIIFLLLIFLIVGCTADYPEQKSSEELVYIHFSTSIDVNVGVTESTRNESSPSVACAGLLGLGVQSEELPYTTLERQSANSFRDWMSNDKYIIDNGHLVHSLGRIPSFPLEDNSAVAAYAYIPYTEQLVYGEESCYIPLDLMADCASTDWMYSGRTARTKSDYIQDSLFGFNFRHAMTRLDMSIQLSMPLENDFRILEIDLGLFSHGKGLLSLEDGKVVLDTISWVPDSVYRLQRQFADLFFPRDALIQHTETYYLIPYTHISDFKVIGLWDETDTLVYHYNVDTLKWNYRNIHPGERSVISIKSISK